ncbi:MAG: DUF302 domain-containing protein [Phormidesmis sp. RL_2_1]|nr:DUF302 domain-containing protein [Phormidesmis sp. RL_2_1]
MTIVIGSRPGSSLPTASPTGLVIKPSPHSVLETESRFVSILEEKGLNVLTTVDHAQNAEGAGLTLRPTRVVLFGNPQLGTPLMQCNQSIAIDLPQKMLIWEDESGQVQIAYNDPRYLGGRHRLGECGNDVIKQIASALDTFSNGAISP